MVYEVKKTIKPSDIYPSLVIAAGTLSKEEYAIIAFRPPMPGEHYLSITGKFIVGCCSPSVDDDPRFIVAKCQLLSDIWE